MRCSSSFHLRRHIKRVHNLAALPFGTKKRRRGEAMAGKDALGAVVSGNLNTRAGAKEPQNREEGELSSGEEDADLPIHSVAPCDSTTAAEPCPLPLGSNHLKSSKIGSSSSLANVKSVPQNYGKNSRMKQVPFMVKNNRTLHWQKKVSDDNLVISFSDDESGSDSEKSKLEESVERNDCAVSTETHKMPMTSLMQRNVPVHETQHMNSQISKQGFVKHASISSITRNLGTHVRRAGASSSTMDPRNQKHSTSKKASPFLVDGNIKDMTLAVNKLESLRTEIALRESELKVQKKSMAVSREKSTDSYSDQSGQHSEKLGSEAANTSRVVPAKTVELSPDGRPLKRSRLEHQIYKNQCSDDQSQLPVTFTKSMTGNSKQSIERGSYNDNRSEMSCHGNDMQKFFVRTNSRGDNQHDQATKNVQLSSAVQNAGAEDNVTLVPSSEFLSYMPFGKENNGVLAGDHVHTTEEVMPVESSTRLNQTSHLMKMINDIENANLLTCEGQMGNPGQGSMRLKSLLELEDLQDKELEEAQEFRRKCELEERRALKAYRKAQKALVEANERCAILYRKRELYSAGLHGLIMDSSSSMWHSSWHNHSETLSDSLKYFPRARHDFLSLFGHKIPAESQIFEQLGDKSKVQGVAEAPHQLTGGHDSRSGQCYDPAASTSDPKDICDTYGACAPPKNHNMSTDDEEENVPFSATESRLECNTNSENRVTEAANMVVDRNGLPSEDTRMDYELLEASLRSELVARFGKRVSSKSTDLNNVECLSDKVAERKHDKPSALLNQQMQETWGNNIAKSGGTMEPGSDVNQLSGQSHGGRIPSKDDGCHRVIELEENNSSHKESSLPPCGTVSILPSSVLQSVSKNLRWIFPDICGGCSTPVDNNCRSRGVTYESVVSVPDVVQDHAENCSTRCSVTGNMGCDMMDFVVDPFWPFCIFELRGRCNDEECPWQHAKTCSWRKLKENSHSITSASGRLCFRLFQHLLPVPTYHIGLSLIKADSYLSQSVLSGSTCQYWQRGFCASFPLPFSIRRILPLDAPFLQAGNGSVADYNWNKHLLYYRSQDGTMKKPLPGLPDSEQSLELALDFSCGKVCQPERKKALVLLARAIEADPNSVLLWVIYLNVYFRKERGIGKDDMFLHAVQHNRYSYELWLMYINSRLHLDRRLDAYNDALSMLCHMTATSNMEIKDKSAFILDILLQMIDFLCMCGSIDKALSQIYGLLAAPNAEHSGDKLLTTVVSCLIISDRCIFWVCCIYLSVYRKLPEAILEQFELEKDLPFGIEWPSTELPTDKKDQAIELLRYAVHKVSIDIDEDLDKGDPLALRSSHFLAVSHISCVAVLQGLKSAADLMVKYMRLYPTCTDIFLISARLGENHGADVGLGGFEEMLCNWPKEVQGLQCLWNQYAEHLLANKRIDLAENLMIRWFQLYGEVGDAQCRNTNDGANSLCSSSELSVHVVPKDDGSADLEDYIFWFLNLSLYNTLQKNISEAQLAVDKAIKVGGHKFYKYCLGEHAGLHLLNEGSAKDLPGNVILDLISGYTRDQQILPLLEPLSRRYYQNIRKGRIRQLVDESLGPISTDFSLINAVLEVCYGPSLLPEKVGQLKDLVDFVDSVMEITPSNYQLALSVYRFALRNFSDGGVASEGMMFWASAVLVNSIFQAVPAAPEPVWLEAANLLGNSGASEISRRFHQQAVSVYPFSIKLWQSHLNLSKITGNADSIIEAAKERGVKLNLINP